MAKYPTTIRISDEGKRLLVKLAEKLAISRTAVIEIAIREKAKKEEIT